MEKNCLTQKVCSSWINNDDLYEGTNPILREDDVNMLSTCLRCGKRKNMQLFMNHVEVECTCNGCKNIMNCIVHPYAFSTCAYFNKCIPNGSMG